MLSKSDIEWTEVTWNFATGCSKVSAGCQNCYAELFAKRLKAMGQPKYKNEFDLTIHEKHIEDPLKWKKPRIVFVNSMSDIFHEDVPFKVIKKAFDVMNQAHWHTFQVLTKRADRLCEFSPKLNWTPNIWMGVTVENDSYLERIELLKKTGAKIKFLSIEPLLGPLDELNVNGIDWVIVGGESGNKARFVSKEWVIDIRDKCLSCNVPFFFKQWGGRNKKKTGRILDGKTWDQMPNKLENCY